MRVGLVTCRPLPEPDPDEEPLLAALRARGLAAELVPWERPGADLARLDVCVLRSCWNYHERPGAFLDFVARASRATRLWNPEPVVRWNVHKRYLAGLEERGIPVVPTAFVDRGAGASLRAVRDERGWDDVVVKPAVSAASYRTARFGPGEERAGEAFLAALVADRDALVQPYVSAVEDGGERALVWIAGEWTHAVAKRPRFTGDEERVSDEALSIADDERRLAERALAGLEDRLLYARVDVIRGADGTLALSELELIEPSLFLLQSPAALERLVEAIARA